MDKKDLINLATEVREKAYAPYSGFRVGAALLMKSGKVYKGVNIENASFGATNCAERSAVFTAVSNGEKEIQMIAISSDSEDYIYPCGICRQVLSEFGDDSMIIICTNKAGEYREYTLGQLLPGAFREF